MVEMAPRLTTHDGDEGLLLDSVLSAARAPERKRVRRFPEGVTTSEMVGTFVPPVASMCPNVIPGHVPLLVYLLPKGLHAGDQRPVRLGFPRTVRQISGIDGIGSNQRARI